jgi:hypothetical protein
MNVAIEASGPEAECRSERSARRTVSRAVLALAVLLLCPLALAQPQTRIVGGPGGTPFADQAPPTMRLVAVAMRSGEEIDAIAAVLRRPNGERFPVPMHGGPGGSPGAFVMQDGEFLTALNVWAGQFIEAIQFETNQRQSRIYGRPRGAPQRIAVPAGQHAIGFVGRSGVYIDAIGLSLQPGDLGPQAGVGAHPPPGAAAPTTPVETRKPMRPIAPTASARVLLDGPVYVPPFSSTSSSLTIRVRLKEPAPLTVSLGAQRPRSGTCFAAGEIVATQASSQAQIEHVVRFSGLGEGNRYYYSIPVDGGRCETGSASTASCQRTNDPKDNQPC